MAAGDQSPGTTSPLPTAESPLEFWYFPLWARVAPALALEHSGLPWVRKTPQNEFPNGWKDMKGDCDFGCLPVLKNLPAFKHQGKLDQIGQEAAVGGERQIGQEAAVGAERRPWERG